MITYTTFAHTIAKSGKTQNGDHVKIVENDDFILALLADGISSQPCDFYASQLACESMAEYVQTNHASLSDREALLQQAMVHTNQQLLDETGKCEGLGTTLCGLFWEKGKDEVFYFWIGDSRIFYFDQQQLTQISKDDKERVLLSKHARPGDQIASRNYLTNSLGRKDCRTRVLKNMFQPGDALIMATDGFFEAAYSYEKDLINHISKPDLEMEMKQLFQRYRPDQKDDASVVILRREFSEPDDNRLLDFVEKFKTEDHSFSPYYEAHMVFYVLKKGIETENGDWCNLMINRIKLAGLKLERARLISLLELVVKTKFNPDGLYQELGFLIRKS